MIISEQASQAGGFEGMYFQPKEVAYFVTSFIKEREVHSVYNPFAGTASYQIDNRYTRFYSQEINRGTWIIGKIRLLLNDIGSDYYLCEDSVEKWQRIKFDTVISTPPFGGKIEQNRYFHTSGQYFSHREYDSFYIDYALNSITPDGIVISIIPLSFLFRSGSYAQQFKSHIVNNGYIQKVILLPSNIFYGTTLKAAVVVLTKTPNNGVIMVDGSNFFKKEGRLNVLEYKELLRVVENSESHCVKYVSNEEIVANDFNLNPAL